MDTLKHCPFCAKEAVYMEDDRGEFMGWIQCGSCEADGPCPHPYENTREEAAKLWNTRKPPVARPEGIPY